MNVFQEVGKVLLYVYSTSIQGWISYYATFFLLYMVSASLMGSYKANSVFNYDIRSEYN